jgi:hypothetical protein
LVLRHSFTFWLSASSFIFALCSNSLAIYRTLIRQP